MTVFRRVKPNIYRYATRLGRRYAVRLQIGQLRRWRKGFVSQEQAQQYLDTRAARAAAARHLPDQLPGPTLAEYATAWLEQCRLRGLKPHTLRSYAQNLEDHVLPYLGQRDLTSITRQDIITWLLARRDGGWSKAKEPKVKRPYTPNALRLMLAPLSRLFSDAYDAGLVQANPCLKPGRITTVRKRTRDIRAFTRDQEQAFRKGVETHRPDHLALVTVLFGAGLRFGEAIALEVSDVDLSGNRLRVTKAFTDGVLLDSTKNYRGRWVELEPAVRRRLVAHMKSLPPGSRLLFPGQEGGYLDARTWRRRVWDRIIREATLPHYTPHEARHTYATRMLEEGRSLAWLKEQLGHSSIAVTVDTYGHLAREGKALPPVKMAR